MLIVDTFFSPSPALIAWIHYSPITGTNTVRAEIVDADANTRMAWVKIPGYILAARVPFSAIQSVTHYISGHVVASYGRPPALVSPEWCRFAGITL